MEILTVGGLLGISQRNATEALQRLVEPGLLEGLEPAANRVGRYRVNQGDAGKV